MKGQETPLEAISGLSNAIYYYRRIFCSLLLLVTAVVLLIAAAVKRSLWDESNDAAVKSEVTLT